MLDGIRILDLTWVLGGPFAGQLLAQLGCEVVKIEPLEGDLSRSIPPHYFEGDSSFYLSANRGKKSVALDLKAAEGRAVLYDLVRTADTVIYGFAPDVPARLGIDFASLAKINPHICVGELIGLHDEGPYAKAPAFDLVVQAMGGVMSITGEGGKPARVGYQIADLAGGLYLALGVMGAMLSSARSGRGRKVQVSLLDCQLSLLTWQAQNYFVSGEIPRAQGSRHHMIAPSEVFACADGKYLSISPTGEAFWQKFCEAIERPGLARDARFRTAKERIANVDALARELANVFAQRPVDAWTDTLFAERIPAGKVNDVAEAVSQPLAALRNMVEALPHPVSGALMQFLGNPFKYESAATLAYPPALGADTEAVLREWCGYDASRIAQLMQSATINSS